MQVEVSIQDYFSQSGEFDCSADCEDRLSIHPESATALIPTETWANWFQSWLVALRPGVFPSQTYELSLRLTNNQEIQLLNAYYRQQDHPTDVLAFAALEAIYPQPLEMASLPVYLGDIVISVDTACQQAKEHQHSLETELAWLATHGLLHLLGWDHPDETSLIQMLNLQDVLLETIGLTSKERLTPLGATS